MKALSDILKQCILFKDMNFKDIEIFWRYHWIWQRIYCG